MAANHDYHLKWDLIEDPFPAEWDKQDGKHRYNLEQTRHYLESCLVQAGGEGQAVFSDEDVQRIYLASGGVPGRINQLARQTLCDPADAAAFRSPATLRLELWVLGGAAGVAILILFSMLILPKQGEDAGVKNVPVALPETPRTVETDQQKDPDKLLSLKTGPVKNTGNLISKEKPADSKAAKPKSEVVAKTPEPQETETKEETKTVAATAAEKPAAQTSPPAKKEALILKPEFKPPEKVLIAGVKTQDWVDEQDWKKYTLQLVGAEELETIERYIARTGLKKPDLALVETMRNNRPWYVLLYGVYPDKARARAAIAGLPAYARKLGPWPRQLAELARE